MRNVCSLLGVPALFAAIIGLLVSGSLDNAGDRLAGFVASAVIALVGIGFMAGAIAFRPVAPPPFYPQAQPPHYPPQY